MRNRHLKIAAVSTLLVLFGALLAHGQVNVQFDDTLEAYTPVDSSATSDGITPGAESGAVITARTNSLMDYTDTVALESIVSLPGALYQIDAVADGEGLGWDLLHRGALHGRGAYQTVFRAADGSPASEVSMLTTRDYVDNETNNRQWLEADPASLMTTGMIITNVGLYGSGYTSNNWHDDAAVPHDDPYVLNGLKLWSGGGTYRDLKLMRIQGTGLSIDRGEGETFSGVEHFFDSEINRVEHVFASYTFTGVHSQTSDTYMHDIDSKAARDAGIVLTGGGSYLIKGHAWNCLTDATWPGTVDRDDDETGTLTMTDALHGIEDGDVIDLTWSGGSRFNILVDSVSGTTVEIGVDNSGYGDALPADSTAISVPDPNMGVGFRTGVTSAASGPVMGAMWGLDNDRCGWINHSIGTSVSNIFGQLCGEQTINLQREGHAHSVCIYNMDAGATGVLVGRRADYSSIQADYINTVNGLQGEEQNSIAADIIANFVTFKAKKINGGDAAGGITPTKAVVIGRETADEEGQLQPTGITVEIDAVAGYADAVDIRGLGSSNRIYVRHFGTNPLSGGVTSPIDNDNAIDLSSFGNWVVTEDMSAGTRKRWGSTGAYTLTNDSTDRAFDANATSTDELADVLATLIKDLRLYGIVPQP